MRKIVGFDTETFISHGAYQFMSAQFWNPDLKMTDFVTDAEQIRKYFTTKTRGAIFLAQNAEYDFSVLRKVFQDDWFTFKCLFNKGRFMYGKLVHNDHAYTFYDLRNIFVNWSLKKVGEFIHLPKLTSPSYLGKRKPQNNEEWQYLKQYALRDAEICYEAGKWIQQKLGEIRISAPSLSFNVFNKQFQPYGVYLSTTDEIEGKIRLAYKGGRNECFIRGSPDKKVYVYDVVSLYPYCMKTHKMPLGIDGIKKSDHIDLSREGIAFCKVFQNAEIPFLSTRTFTPDGTYKLMFPNGIFKAWFTYPEIRYFLWHNLGDILETYETYEVNRLTRVFEPFIDHFFKLKETDKEGASFWKLFMNSLYGKFAQNIESPEVTLSKDVKVTKLTQKAKRKFLLRSNVLISAYITAYGRIHMHSHYTKVGLENLVYTDTDSIHTLKKLSDVGEGLGQLSFKGETDNPRRATYIRGKFYLFNDGLKCKGLQYVLTASDMRKLIEIGNVKILTTMLLKIRSAFIRHKELLSETDMIKHFTLNEDGKRSYNKLLKANQLLTEYTRSKAVDYHGLE